MRNSLVAAVLIVAGLAGCTSAPAPGADPLAVERATYDAIDQAVGAPIVEDHDHADPALHKAHYNLDLVAQVKGEEGRTPQPTEGYLETAVKGGYAYLCRTGPDQGLVIFDVHDIEHPKQVGFIKIDAGFEADVEVSDDGHWAFWETQRFPTAGGVPSLTDPGANAPHGIHIIDISDKANPKWVGFQEVVPDGPHSITYANITGRHIVFASTYAFAYAYENIAVPNMQREVIYELDTSLPVPQLKQLAEYMDPQAAEPNPVMPEGGKFPHDVSISVHPFTGKTYAYVAYWNLGIVILDVTDPAHPTKVGQATDFGPAPYREVHMARQSEVPIDGKVVLVAEPEIGGQPDSGYMTFFDGTDPTNVTYLSSWRIPGNITSVGGSLGPHYFDFKDGRVVMASYHAGYWVIDVHDAQNLAHPRTAGFAETDAVATGTGLPGPANLFGAGPNAFDAWWADATHVVAGDVHGGLDVFRFTGPIPAIDVPAA